MSAGLGSLSSFGLATETTALTAVDPAVFLPINSESLQANRNPVPSGSIVGDSMVQAVAMGISNVEGGFNLEIEGSVSGQAIWLWSGNDGYSHAAMTLYATAAPTGAAAAGGTLAAGTYKYGVSTVLNRTNDNVNVIMPVTATSAGIVLSASDLTTNLTFTVPGTLLSGYTHVGTIIWRSLIGASTLYFLKYVSGTGTSTTDTGSIVLPNTNITPYTASIYSHIFVGSPPVSGDRLKAFTATVNHNNDKSFQYITCRMDQMKLSVSGMDDKLMGDFTCKGAAAVRIANFTPTFVPLEPMVGWHCVIQMNGVADATLESFEINCSNNVQPVPGMRGAAFNRDTISGARKISGQMTRQFEDTAIWQQMLNGLDFTLLFTSYGQCIANPVSCGITSTTTNSTIDAIPFQYYIKISLPRCKLSKAGGNVGGPDRMIETVGFEAFKDQTTGTDMTITMYNTTSAYA